MPAGGLGGHLGQPLHFLVTGAEVGSYESPVAPGRADVGDYGVAAGLVASADDDEGATVGQRLRDGDSEASGGTGDKCCAAQ